MNAPGNRSARKVMAGDVLLLTAAASVQFMRPITVRVIRVLEDWHTYDGWLWIETYQLGPNGDAVERRSLYFMPAGAQWVDAPTRDRARATGRRPVSHRPARVG